MEAREQMPVGADPHGGQLRLSEEVAKVLAELEEHGYFGCRGQRLDHDVVETLAGMENRDAQWVLQQFETRVSDGQSFRTSVALAEFIAKILQAHAL